jgi:hypothetical protein
MEKLGESQVESPARAQNLPHVRPQESPARVTLAGFLPIGLSRSLPCGSMVRIELSWPGP